MSRKTRLNYFYPLLSVGSNIDISETTIQFMKQNVAISNNLTFKKTIVVPNTLCHEGILALG